MNNKIFEEELQKFIGQEKEALEFMKRMSDQRKKPVRQRRFGHNNGNDW